MIKPIANWDGLGPAPDVVWWTRLDGRYQIEVQRLGQSSDYTANLVIFDRDNEYEVIHCELSYGAIFGPDADDVRAWQEKCIKIIDAR